jgi:hypothetical protein
VSRIDATDFAVAPAADGTSCRLECRVSGGGLPDTLWFEAQGDATGMLSDRGNWAAVALLYPAMRTGADLHVDAALSPQLLDALDHDVQAFLKVYDPALRPVRVTCRTETADGPRGPLVATGFSAGIDSFATLSRYLFEPIHQNLAVSALAVFDVGAFGRESEPHFTRAASRCDAFASAHGLRSLALRSNLDAVYRSTTIGRPGFEKTNTFRNVAAALALEAGLGRYYVSSSFAPHEIGVRDIYNPAYLDPILLPLLSTERMTLVSACAGLTRVEKTRLVAALPQAEPLLDVCTRPWERIAGASANCSHCPKCTRTLFTLEAIDRLDAFAAVFDIAGFRRRRDHHLGELQSSAAGGNSLDAEVLNLLQAAAGTLPRRKRRWRWF